MFIGIGHGMTQIRQLISGHRLSNIRIGTTDVSPSTTTPTPTNIAICASQDPAVAEGATQQFTCGGQGRYLVVLLEGTGKTLTLCEVEVFASKFKTYTLKHSKKNV
jgi:hypothetical protein